MDQQRVVSTLLCRTGVLLLVAASVLAGRSISFESGSLGNPHNGGEEIADSTPNNLALSNETPRPVRGDVQVAAAETHAMSPGDWSRFLTHLAGDLRLGLLIEVSLPATSSLEGPPADPLNRLLWATQTLRPFRIELKVEQGTIRVRTLPPVELPLEAFHSRSAGSHPWEDVKTLQLLAFPARNRELSFLAQATAVPS